VKTQKERDAKVEMNDLQERNRPGDYPSGKMHEDSYSNILLLVFCCGGKFTLPSNNLV
jgi:hypothetical protein